VRGHAQFTRDPGVAPPPGYDRRLAHNYAPTNPPFLTGSGRGRSSGSPPKVAGTELPPSFSAASPGTRRAADNSQIHPPGDASARTAGATLELWPTKARRLPLSRLIGKKRWAGSRWRTLYCCKSEAHLCRTEHSSGLPARCRMSSLIPKSTMKPVFPDWNDSATRHPSWGPKLVVVVSLAKAGELIARKLDFRGVGWSKGPVCAIPPTPVAAARQRSGLGWADMRLP